MAKVIYRTETFGEGDWHVALCPELGISRTGDTPSDAKGCVRDAVESYLRECEWQGILDGVLEDAGFEKTDDVWRLAPRATEELVAVTDSWGDETGDDCRPQNKNYTIKLKSGHQCECHDDLSEADVREKLSEFEAKYGMTSYEFIVKYNSCAFEEENLEFLDWAWYYDAAADVGIISAELRQ